MSPFKPPSQLPTIELNEFRPVEIEIPGDGGLILVTISNGTRRVKLGLDEIAEIKWNFDPIPRPNDPFQVWANGINKSPSTIVYESAAEREKLK